MSAAWPQKTLIRSPTQQQNLYNHSLPDYSIFLNIYLNILDNKTEAPFEARERSSIRFEGGRNFEETAQEEDYRDIDITTNDADITRLAITFAGQTKNRFK